jgi:hypothetical protein
LSAARGVMGGWAAAVTRSGWDAAILELGDWGIRSSRWEDLYLVSAWRRFLTEPDSYFRHLFAG